MIEAVQILWSPAGVTLSALDPLQLVDVTDGDTPNVRLPVRMLSVDTPEVTARTDQRAKAIDPGVRAAGRVDWPGSGADLAAVGRLLGAQAGHRTGRQPAAAAGPGRLGVRQAAVPGAPSPT